MAFFTVYASTWAVPHLTYMPGDPSSSNAEEVGNFWVNVEYFAE
jgi:hypothetical protein